MAKEEAKKPDSKEGGGKKKKMHLHEIRSVQAHDGTIVHHHTYKENPEHPYTMPERGPMATSSSPEEAGQHVQEQFAMNGGGGEPEGDEGQGQAGASPMQPGA